MSFTSIPRCYFRQLAHRSRSSAAALLWLALLFVVNPAWADLRIASWNVLNGGWNNEKSIAKVAHVAAHFDFLALQEVMSEEFMNELERQLESTTGENWSWMASHALGRSTYREHYAFLFRDSAVEYEKGAVVFIDHKDMFAREPYSAQFRSRHTGQAFAAANVHITFGNSISDRLPEIAALADYWNWLNDTYAGVPVLLLGDFNLDPGHEAWSSIREIGAVPAITQGASTLGTAEGRWSNLYDNIWKTAGAWQIGSRGILLYPELLPTTHLESRAQVSDHAPVYITLGNAAITPIKLGNADSSDKLAATAGKTSSTSTGETCINLNSASAEELMLLPQIGEARANEIIIGRPWESPGDLGVIKGLGQARIGAIQASGLLCP